MDESFQRSHAAWLFEIVKHEYEEAKKNSPKGHDIRLQCTTAFGVLNIAGLSASNTGDIFRMEVVEQNDKQTVVLAHASQCSFKFSSFMPDENAKPHAIHFGLPLSN